MIFLHFSSIAMSFPFRLTMASPRLSLKELWLSFHEIRNGLCTCTVTAGSVAEGFSFYHKRGAWFAARGAIGVRDRILWTQPSLLLLAPNLVLLSVSSLLENLS